MKKETLMKFKALFEDQRRALVSRGIVSEEFRLEKDEMLDECDMTSIEMEQSMKMRLRNREALFLKKIDEALARIADGRFGSCEECGDDIEIKRLEVRPTATHCLACKEEQEKREYLHIDGHKHKSLGARLKLRLA